MVSYIIQGLFLISILGGCTSSCNKTDKPVEKSAPKGSFAAEVNGQEIVMEKLDTLHKRSLEKFARTGRPVTEDLSRKIRGSILRKLIDDQLMEQKGASMGLMVDRFDRVAALEKYKERMGGPQAFEAFLKHQELTEAQIEEVVLHEMLREKIVEKYAGSIPVTDEEINSHYQANGKLYNVPEMVHARHILLKVLPTDPPEKQALVKQKAESIVREGRNPEVSFVSLVHKYGEGPSVEKGGDLGFFSRGQMVKEFEDAAFNAPLKQSVGPIKTDYGYHILFVEEKTPARVAPLEEVKPRIVEFITRNKQARKSEELLSSLREKANVKIHDYSLTNQEFLDLSKEEPVAEKKPSPDTH